MKRGFTLVELLVTISMIAMLSSIVIATIAPAKARARDSERLQETRQLDLATQLYISNNGHAPSLTGPTGCQAMEMNDQNWGNLQSLASACFAVSSATSGNAWSNWNTFTNDLRPYMPTIPPDPCPTCTAGSSAYPLGYTYVPPLVLQYNCVQASGNGTCSQSASALNQTYQIYAPLESQSNPSGYNDSGPTNSIVAIIQPAPVISFTPQLTYKNTFPPMNTWKITTTVTGIFQTCTISDTLGQYNTTFNYVSGNTYSYQSFLSFTHTWDSDMITATCNNQGSIGSGQYLRAYMP